MAGQQKLGAEEPACSALSSFILGSLCHEDNDSGPVDPLEGVVDGLFAGRILQKGPQHQPAEARLERADAASGVPDEMIWSCQYPSQSSTAPRSSWSRGQRSLPGDGALHRYGDGGMEEDMLVTSSASEPSMTAAASVATLPSSPEHGFPDCGPGERQAPLGDERARLVRILCALHAVRPSELSFLLSGWQCDWLLLHDGLCPPPALALMQRMQMKRRPRRRHGAKRIGDLRDGDASEPLPMAPLQSKQISTPGAGLAGLEMPENVTASHGDLVAWQQAYYD